MQSLVGETVTVKCQLTSLHLVESLALSPYALHSIFNCQCSHFTFSAVCKLSSAWLSPVCFLCFVRYLLTVFMIPQDKRCVNNYFHFLLSFFCNFLLCVVILLICCICLLRAVIMCSKRRQCVYTTLYRKYVYTAL